MSPLGSHKRVHTWRPDVAACCMMQLQQTGEWRLLLRQCSSHVFATRFVYVRTWASNGDGSSCSSCSSSVVRRCVGVNKRCALNQCDCPATTGTTTAQTTPATATATATSTTTPATTVADKEQELKAQLAGLQCSKEYPDYLPSMPVKSIRSLIVISCVFELKSILLSDNYKYR